MWPNSEETRNLLDAAKTGDPAAREQLLMKFREPLRRVIGLRMDPALARRIDASDIVQDVLIEAHQRLKEYLQSPTMPFHLWLRHMAQDRIIDTHRRHRVAQRRSIDREHSLESPAWADDSSANLVASLIDPENTPASAAIQEELRKKLNAAIVQLPQNDRDIILMRHHEQLSNTDVAAVYQLTEAAASMRYLRALRKLRAVLLPDENPDAKEKS
ncbi:sigma-70 family RNA polymerase sigma factor [Telmatocola sphagniphila]|uniref:Sigma-70 family RNA polymerase sigma factor n=1 Tax=Telmatocola sphagniphila TaxID=1123043 RepID=A0A8E6BAQ4_9BACT|nr:sigma-70 family RNA polymerase sigma factor [Telmatocola sphagniphila]QVL34544.1 sigma-70 family RNA polymerase sigma factor [Telmatocola sphagniphila]